MTIRRKDGQKLGGYTIDLEGNVLSVEPAMRARFNLHAAFSANHAWRELSARVATRPSVDPPHGGGG